MIRRALEGTAAAFIWAALLAPVVLWPVLWALVPS